MISIKDICTHLNTTKINYEYHGEIYLELDGFSSIYNLKDKTISWIKRIDSFDFSSLPLDITGSLIISNHPESKPPINCNFLYCDNPKEVYFSILDCFWSNKEDRPIISNTAIVEAKVIGENVQIGPYSYVGKDVIIGDNVIIKNHVSIEGKVVIGEGSIIYSGAVLGSDGYGLYVDREGLNQKIPHYGGIIIGKNVEIGANTCIDRGTLGDTIIGDNVKIHNLCQIAHNVCIEKNSCIVSGVLISGSAHIAENSYVAPGALIMNQLYVGKDALVGMGAVVTKNVEENTVVAGIPAKPLRKNKGE